MKKKRERGNIEKKGRRNIPVVNLKGKEEKEGQENNSKKKKGKGGQLLKKRLLKGPWSATPLFLFTFGFSIFQKLMYKLLLLCSNSYDLKLKVNPLTPRSNLLFYSLSTIKFL